MGHRIIVGISDEAQRAAARAGQPAAAVQEYGVRSDVVGDALDLDLGDAALQRDVTPAGDLVLWWGARGVPHPTLPALLEPCRTWGDDEWQILGVRPTDAADALRLIAESIAQRRAEQAGRARDAALRYLAGGDDDGLSLLEHLSEGDAIHAEVAAERERRLAVRQAEFAAYDARIVAYVAGGPEPGPGPAGSYYDARVSAEDDRRRRARKLAPLVRLAALAAEHGDDSVRARIAAGERPLGLLPEAEALEVVRAARLPVDEARGLVAYRLLVAADLPDERRRRHDRLTDADLPGGGERGDENDRDSICTASYRAYAATAEEVGGLSAAEWEAVTTIRAALVAAGLPDEEARVHVAECATRRCSRHGDREVTARRVGVRVRLDLGDGLTIEREYGEAVRS